MIVTYHTMPCHTLDSVISSVFKALHSSSMCMLLSNNVASPSLNDLPQNAYRTYHTIIRKTLEAGINLCMYAKPTHTSVHRYWVVAMYYLQRLFCSHPPISPKRLFPLLLWFYSQPTCKMEIAVLMLIVGNMQIWNDATLYWNNTQKHIGTSSSSSVHTLNLMTILVVLLCSRAHRCYRSMS